MSAHKFAIEERRRQVASLLAKRLTQTEIARQLGFDQSTISDDVKALRLMSQQFIYNLAKGDLGFCYKQCLDGIDTAISKAWKIHDTYEDQQSVSFAPTKLAALKVIVSAEVEKFRLLQEGPNILAVNQMSQRLENIEQSFQEANR